MPCTHTNALGTLALAIGSVAVYRFTCEECGEECAESIHHAHVAEGRTGWAGGLVAVNVVESWAV